MKRTTGPGNSPKNRYAQLLPTPALHSGTAGRRLMVVVERYPELKSNQNFLDLQDELAGTENRIAVECRRYNQAVQQYNTMVRRFPTNLIVIMTGFERVHFLRLRKGQSRCLPWSSGTFVVSVVKNPIIAEPDSLPGLQS